MTALPTSTRATLIVAACCLAVGVPARAAEAQEPPSITLLHAIPGAVVDLVVDGAVLIPGFEAGDTQDLTPLAGATLRDVEGRLAGTDEVVIGPIPEFTVPDAGVLSVVVHLDVAEQPTITTFDNAAPQIAMNQGLLTVRNTSAIASIDVAVGSETVLSAIDSGTQQQVEWPAGEVDGVQVGPAGGAPTVAVPTLFLEPNTQLILYVSGTPTAAEVYLQAVDGTVSVASLSEPAPDPTGATDEDDAPASSEPESSEPDAAGSDAAEPDSTGPSSDTAGESAESAPATGVGEPVAINTGDALERGGGVLLSGTGAVVATLAAAMCGAGALMLRRRLH